MKGESDPLTPPKRLAVAYSPAETRAYFTLILEFDVRLAQVVAGASEALIAQMRMAWWRDIIAKPVSERPTGEPLIAALNAVEQDGNEHPNDIGRAMIMIIDAWDILLAQPEWDEGALLAHIQKRGEAVFNLPMADTGKKAVGQIWALHDLANGLGADIGHVIANLEAKMPRGNGRSKRAERHLSLLAMAARRQYQGGGAAAGLRLLLHALTGY